MLAPDGANRSYVRRLAAEMMSGVYALSSDDKVVLDIGANIGMFSLYALRTGVERVICVEPSPGNVECIRANLREYLRPGRVSLIRRGVWSHESILRFSTESKSSPGSHHVTSDGDTEVTVISVDRLVRELGLTRLDYIKMDVEGAELRALEGMRQTIRRFRPRLCIATEHTDDLFENASAVIETLAEMGMTEYVCTESHIYNSPRYGLRLTPYCLLFIPSRADDRREVPTAAYA